LLAHWLCGWGRTVAFTSGRWKHWGTEWAGWPSFSKLWAQTIRWCMQQGTAANYDVMTSIEGDEGRIVIEAGGENDGATSFRHFVGRVVAPDGTSKAVPVVQTGPGRYEGRFEVNEQGTYLVSAMAAGGSDDEPTIIRTGVSVPYSPEFRDLEPNEALLREIALEAEGRQLSLDAQAADVFAHNLPPTVTRTPIWDTLLKLAVFAFLLDVAVRRIAVDPMKALARARAYVSTLAGRFGAGRRAERTLTDLKAIRAKVRDERTGRGDTGAASQLADEAVKDAPAAPKVDAKFETSGPLKKPAADLAASLGGPRADTPPAPKTPAKKDEAPAESTTARLLRARKRARDDLGGGKQD
jgi:hypothetical protein